jgi:glycosyltransferase involved in cell wall biosynthesis
MPVVSVVIPTYGDGSYLQDSVRSALNQSINDTEVIVVDDCSPDPTEEILSDIQDPRLTILHHQTNRGGSAARNTGIQYATGDFVAFLDADDRWEPSKIERQLKCLNQADDETVCVYCDGRYDRSGAFKRSRDVVTDIFGDENNVAKEGGFECAVEWFRCARFAPMGSSSLMFESAVLETVSGFDSGFERNQDRELLIRVLKHGKIRYIDEPLFVKQQTSDSDPKKEYESAKRFLNKFQWIIDEQGINGRKIRSRYMMHVARSYFRDGDFGKGYGLVREYGLGTKYQLLEIAWGSIVGLRKRLVQ